MRELLLYYVAGEGRALRRPILVRNPGKIKFYEELKKRNGLSWLEVVIKKEVEK